MRKSALALIITIAPAVAGAQSSASASSSTKASATIETKKSSASLDASSSTQGTFEARRPGTSTRGEATAEGAGAAEFRMPERFSAETRARIEAMLGEAAEKQLPRKPIEDRVAEGAVKGAADAQVLAAGRHVLANLESAHDVMVSAGRARPSEEEVARGANVLARGYSSAQLETVVKSAPAERSLVVAFDVLSHLAAEGRPVATALAQVSSKLQARADDEAIRALAPSATLGAGTHGAAHAAAPVARAGSAGAGIGASAGAAAGAAVGGAGAAVGGAAGATGAVGGAAAGTGVVGGAAGAVTGRLGRKP